MQRFIFTLAAFLLALFSLGFSLGLHLSIAIAQNSAAQNKILLFEGDTIEWKAEEGKKTIQFNDITIKLTPKPDDYEVRFDISKPNEKNISFKESGLIGAITAARFTSEPMDSDYQPLSYNLAFAIFDGGAHCCSQVYILDYSNGAKLIKIGSFDGDLKKPIDLDGDGVMEYDDYDSRFGIFSSYAGAMPPMKIYTFDHGKVRDSTLDERFIGAHEAYFKRQSNACKGLVKENTGACAGLLGTAAILGVADATFAQLDFDSPATDRGQSSAPYEICTDNACTKNKRFNDEKSAFAFALTKWGYVPSQYSENNKITAFIAALKGKNFADSQDACLDGPLSLAVKKLDNNHIIYDVSRYEAGCYFENGALIGNSLLTKAVCMGEGEPMWLENHIYTYDGKQLSHSSFTSTRFGDMLVQNLTACKN